MVNRPLNSRKSQQGFTLLEVIITMVVLSVLMIGIVTAVVGIQGAFLQGQLVSQVNGRAQKALERIVQMASQAVTIDAQFTPLKPTTGVNSHCLRFRIIQSIDSVTGNPIYDDNLVVFIYGPDTGASPCSGLIIGRGPTLTSVYTTGRGPDAILGTPDDDTSTAISGGIPAVELLVPSNFAPSTGEMFTVNLNPAPFGRLVTFTLRMNAVDADGNFVFPNDLVFTERVALLQ